MDVNETRFHLVLRHCEWLGGFHDGLDWNDSLSALTLRPRLFRFPTPAQTPSLQPRDRRGADCDRYGNWYFISSNRDEILLLPAGQTEPVHFRDARDLSSACQKDTVSSYPGRFHPMKPLSGPRPLSMKFQGLAVTGRHYLVAGILEPAGLLVIDLHSGGPPSVLTWPAGEPFSPFDITAHSCGGVWILDRENARCWKLNSRFQLDPPYPFQLDARHAVAIETAPGGFLIILDTPPDRPYSTVYLCYYDNVGKFLTCRGQSLKPLFEPGNSESNTSQIPSHLRGYDAAFVAVPNGNRCINGTLYIADIEGNQAFAFRVEADTNHFLITLQPDYYPLPYYSGKALVSTGTEVFYDRRDRWLPLTRMPRNRYRESGWVNLPVFDGKEPRCVWHRLFIDGYIPSGTVVTVESFASDDPDDYPVENDERWFREPRPFLRACGAELPFYEPFLPDSHPLDGAGTWELLFQEARGRYLHLRLTLAGSGIHTPILFNMRVYYPRFSYLNEYLPDLYREGLETCQSEAVTGEEQPELDRENRDPVSFLDRFLANFEGIYTWLEDRIAGIQVLFDSDTTCARYLDWLAGWFGVLLDPAWNEDRRRLFLRYAPQLFRQRGTVAGIIYAVRLAVESCPGDWIFEDNGAGEVYQKAAGYRVRIVEGFLTRKGLGVVYGDPTGVTGPAVLTGNEPWRPGHGPDLLDQYYRRFLEDKYRGEISALNAAWEAVPPYGSFQQVHLSPTVPTVAARIKDRKMFLEKEVLLTFAPASELDQSHLKAYIEFLVRKYKRVNDLNMAYGTQFSSFKEINPPGGKLPSHPVQLEDWILFVSTVLPAYRDAHSFTVLVPVEIHMEARAILRYLEKVKRIVEIEKPAHTTFDVKPYWAMFQVGTARVGYDTIPGPGSRFTALVLGENSLDDSYLQIPYPWNIEDRYVVGDAL